MDLSDSWRSSREKSKNNLKMTFVLQGYFWLPHPIFPLLWSLFCTIMNLPVHSGGKQDSSWQEPCFKHFQVLAHLINTTAPVIMSTSTEGETEAQRGWVTCPRSHSKHVMESGLKAQAAWHQNLTLWGRLTQWLNQAVTEITHFRNIRTHSTESFRFLWKLSLCIYSLFFNAYGSTVLL